jgi:hypothetical protein
LVGRVQRQFLHMENTGRNSIQQHSSQCASGRKAGQGSICE